MWDIKLAWATGFCCCLQPVQHAAAAVFGVALLQPLVLGDRLLGCLGDRHPQEAALAGGKIPGAGVRPVPELPGDPVDALTSCRRDSALAAQGVGDGRDRNAGFVGDLLDSLALLHG